MSLSRRLFLQIASLVTFFGVPKNPIPVLDPKPLTPSFPLPKATAHPQLMWGTYGKSGKQPLKVVQLGACSTEHLYAILKTQWQISNEYRAAIWDILNIRCKMEKENPELRKVHYECPEAPESRTT